MNSFIPWPHGDHTIGIRDNVLEIRAQGPFNVQEVKRYVRDVEELLPSLSSPWAKMVIFERDGSLVQDASEELRMHHLGMLGLGLSAIALAIEDSRYFSWIQNQFNEVYRNSGIEISYHKTVGDAWAWIEEWKKTL